MTQVVSEIRVYNRFKQRTLIHGDHKAPPNAFATVPADVAKVWMKMYPEDVVEAGVAQKELGGLGAELAEVKAKLAKAEAALAAVKTDPKGVKALEVANARIADLEKKLSQALV